MRKIQNIGSKIIHGNYIKSYQYFQLSTIYNAFFPVGKQQKIMISKVAELVKLCTKYPVEKMRFQHQKYECPKRTTENLNELLLKSYEQNVLFHKRKIKPTTKIQSRSNEKQNITKMKVRPRKK